MADEENERRYRRLLEEFGEFVKQTQTDRARRDEAMAEMSNRLNMYWQATAAGLRQISDWITTYEDEARRERSAERARRTRREWATLALLLILVLGGAFALYHFWR